MIKLFSNGNGYHNYHSNSIIHYHYNKYEKKGTLNKKVVCFQNKSLIFIFQFQITSHSSEHFFHV